MTEVGFLSALFGIWFALAVLPKVVAILHAKRGWRRVALGLKCDLETSWLSLSLKGKLDGRPVTCRAMNRWRRAAFHTSTEVTVHVRHPDDVVAGLALPSSFDAAWVAAWQDAEIRAGLADLPRPAIIGRASRTVTVRGLVGDTARLVALVRGLADPLDAVDRLAVRWRDAAPALDMRLRGAWLLEGEWRGGWVRIVAELLSGVTVIRVAAEPRGIGEDRWNEEARSLEAAVSPVSVGFELHAVSVVLSGLEPDEHRWLTGLALAVALAEAPRARIYR